MVAAGELSMGHARALIPADDAEALAEEVVRRDLSVRETEKLVRSSKPKAPSASRGSAGAFNADIEALERQLGDMLGLRVKITHRPDGGLVALSYSSLDQLDMICQRLSGERI
jgi:ParB family chromosome partitioning protein